MTKRVPKLTVASVRRALKDLPSILEAQRRDAEDKRSLRGKYAPETGVCLVCSGTVRATIDSHWDGVLGGEPPQCHIAHWSCDSCGIMYKFPPKGKTA